MTRFPQPHPILPAPRSGSHWPAMAVHVRLLPLTLHPVTGVFA